MYEFLGCYWHGHSCLPNIGSNLQQERLTKTRLRLQHTLELGYDLEVMWECEWKRRIRMKGDVGRFGHSQLIFNSAFQLMNEEHRREGDF